MKQRKTKGIAWLLIGVMVIGSFLPYSTNAVSAKMKETLSKKSLKKTTGLEKLSNPRIEKDESMEAGQRVTWDCVWFGSYPQAEVISSKKEYTALDKKLLEKGDLLEDDALYQELKSATGWNSQEELVLRDSKYRRVRKTDVTYSDEEGRNRFYQWKNPSDYHYFKYQPIKWRVLSVDGSEALLLSDKVLDDKQYNTVLEDVTWEDCTIRSWMNGYTASANKQNIDYSKQNFVDTAFSASDQVIIKNSSVENKDNQDYGTMAGNNTEDKIFLLSEYEAYTDAAKKHGFVADNDIFDGDGYIHSQSTYDEARRAKSSLYAKAMGIWSTDGNGVTISSDNHVLDNEAHHQNV